jgi:hypothetical protein
MLTHSINAADLRKAIRSGMKSGLTMDAVLARTLAPPKPALKAPTTDAKRFRTTFRDELKKGRTIDEAIKLGCISGTKNPDPMPHSETAASSSSYQRFKDSFRKALKNGTPTTDAISMSLDDASDVDMPASPTDDVGVRGMKKGVMNSGRLDVHGNAGRRTADAITAGLNKEAAAATSMAKAATTATSTNPSVASHTAAVQAHTRAQGLQRQVADTGNAAAGARADSHGRHIAYHKAAIAL